MNNQNSLLKKLINMFLIPSITTVIIAIILIACYFPFQEKEYKITEKHHKLLNGDIIIELINDNNVSVITDITIDFYDKDNKKISSITKYKNILKKSRGYKTISQYEIESRDIVYKTYKIKTKSRQYINNENYNKDIKIKESIETASSIIVHYQNNSSKNLNIDFYVLFYDAKDKIIGYEEGHEYNALASSENYTRIFLHSENQIKYKKYQVFVENSYEERFNNKNYNKDIEIKKTTETASNIIAQYQNNSSKNLNIDFYVLFYDDKDNIIDYEEKMENDCLAGKENYIKIPIPKTKERELIKYNKYQVFVKKSYENENSLSQNNSNIEETVIETSEKKLLFQVKNNNDYVAEVEYTIELYNDQDEIIDILHYKVQCIEQNKIVYFSQSIYNEDYKTYKIQKKVYKVEDIKFYTDKVEVESLTKEQPNLLLLKYKNSSGINLREVEIAIVFYDSNNNIINIKEVSDSMIKKDSLITRKIYIIGDYEYVRYEAIVNYAYSYEKENS